jgi:hypothetical protein
VLAMEAFHGVANNHRDLARQLLVLFNGLE